MAGVNASATDWNTNFSPTKYVANVGVDAGTGIITVTYSAATPQISGKSLVLAPFINNVALATTLTGNIDWGCAASTAVTAGTRGMTVAVPGTPVEGRYVPTECK